VFTARYGLGYLNVIQFDFHLLKTVPGLRVVSRRGLGFDYRSFHVRSVAEKSHCDRDFSVDFRFPI